MREVALANAKKIDPSAHIVFDEKRLVNGREILALQIAVVNTGIAFRFFGYYHGGSSGSVQVVAFTLDNMFEKRLDRITGFLNGLEVSDQDLPGPSIAQQAVTSGGVLLLNDRMSIRYDPSKWHQKQSEQVGRFTFSHTKGDAYALIIAERLPIPTDSFPDIALKNAQNGDPNAKIVSQEKRTVNGVEVWFLNMALELHNVGDSNDVDQLFRSDADQFGAKRRKTFSV